MESIKNLIEEKARYFAFYDATFECGTEALIT